MMAKRLLFMRIGERKSSDRKSLKSKSKLNVQRMGLRLGALAPRLDRAIHSRSGIARETCHKALKAGEITLKLAGEPDKDTALMDVLTALSDELEQVLIVADLDELRPLLEACSLPADACEQIPHGAMIQVELRGAWRGFGAAECIYRQTVLPQHLPRRFPYITDSGTSYRDRPAYYYTQSAVIPCRMSQGELQILLISSSGGGKCGVPKGIAEPDMTPWDSAAKEAFEEAGVIGQVMSESMGNYRFKKWGGLCSVEVFPLWVTRELPENEWEESHRNRQWVSAEEAAARVTIRELAPLIHKLVQESPPCGSC